MIRDPAAKRYARAAFDIAREGDALEGWAAALEALAALGRRPEVSAFLLSSKVPLAEKHRLLEGALAGVEPLALNLAKLLVAKGRFGLAEQLGEEFLRLRDEERGIAHVQVTAAVPLSSPERDAVTQRLREMTGQEVVLEEAVEPGLLGGLVLRIGDRLIDGSTRTRLLALRRSLTDARR